MQAWKTMRLTGLILLTMNLLCASHARATIVTLDSDQEGDYTFSNNITYYISWPMTVWGTATFQGGAVIKSAGQLTVESLDCETASNNPAIFTGPDDDSVGDVLPGSTGDPTYDYVPASLGIDIDDDDDDTDTSVFVHDMDFYNNYAGTALDFNNNTGGDPLTYTIWNVDMENIYQGIEMGNGGGYDSINVTNLTMTDCGAIANGYFLQGTFVNSTFNNVTAGFVSDIWGYGYQPVNFYWCTFSNSSLGSWEVMVSGSDNGFANCGNFSEYDYLAGETDGSNYFGGDWYYLSNLVVPINFTVRGNLYANTNVVPVMVNVMQGVPFSIALLVNDTNNADASWSDFTSSNLVVTLGSTDGVYNVRVGLSNLPQGANPAWRNIEITLDTAPPVITITNPTSPTVTRPYIQLQGYADKTLFSISYDETNMAGVVTNVMGFVQGQTFDTNLFDYTTNFFQCYDVPLTNGLNKITLHMTDRSGNVTVTNFSYTLDYSGATNPPVMSLTWPQPGMLLGGTNFAVRGMLNDETATVAAQIVDSYGNTNNAAGLVERTGRFWVENLPLTNGDSSVTLTATDAAGNVTVTNFTVTQSTVAFTMRPVTDDLFQPSVTVRGYIDDPDATVYVNGVQGTNYGDGTWEADGVPAKGNGTGTVTLDAKAQAAGGTTSEASASQEADMGASVRLVSYHETETDDNTSSHGTTKMTWTKDYSEQYSSSGDVSSGYSGSADLHNVTVDSVAGNTRTDDSSYSWSDGDPVGDDDWSEILTGVFTNSGDGPMNSELDGWGKVPSTPDVDAGAHHYAVKGGSYNWTYNGGGATEDVEMTANTKETLYAGGKAAMKRQVLVCVHFSATEIGQALGGPPVATLLADVTSSSTALGQMIGSDGNVWVVMPAGGSMGATVTAPVQHVDIEGGDTTTYNLDIMANGQDITTTTPTFCVGQKITFGLATELPDGVEADYDWALSGTFVNRSAQANSHSSVNWDIDPNSLLTATPYGYWVDHGNKNAYLHINFHFSNGQSATASLNGQFNMFKPQTTIQTTTGTVAVDDDYEDDPTALHYGTPDYIPGITFHNTAAITSGDIKWLQVINHSSYSAQRNDGSELGPFQANDALDNTDPYGSNPDDINTTADSPGFGLAIPEYFQSMSASGDFKMYLEFQPPGGIWVPLRVVNWNWNGIAIRSGTNWVLTTAPHPDPNPSDSDATTFPSWTSIFTNHHPH